MKESKLSYKLCCFYLALCVAVLVAGLFLSAFNLFKFYFVSSLAESQQHSCVRGETTAACIRKNILNQLEKIATMPRKVKQQSFIVIPHDVSAFWSWPKEPCSSVAFIVPAITKVALLYGLPLAEKCAIPTNGFYGYEPRDLQAQRNLKSLQSIDNVCDGRAGKAHIFYFNKQGDYQVIKC